MSIFNTDQLKLVSACLGRSKWLVLTGARARADQAMWQDKFQCDFFQSFDCSSGSAYVQNLSVCCGGTAMPTLPPCHLSLWPWAATWGGVEESIATEYPKSCELRGKSEPN